MFTTKKLKRKDTEFTVRIYEPEYYVGSLLILHGMSEHKRRYHNMLKYLKDNNIYGVIYDHRGHGSRQKTRMGHFDSFVELVEDAEAVFDLLPKDKPRFVLGHSMGSIVLRVLLKDIEPDGAIIVGTGTKDSTLDKIGSKLINSLTKVLPKRHSPLINKLGFMGYDERIKGNMRNRWLSSNYANIYEYNRDPLSGNMMSNSVFKETNNAMFLVDHSAYISTYPKNTRYLFLSGKDDAFSHYGKDIALLRDKFSSEGLDAEAILYEGYRHEVLNEGTRYEIYDTIIEWMKQDEK